MNYRKRNLGGSVAGLSPFFVGLQVPVGAASGEVLFLLPSLKLKEPSLKGPSIENRLHSFLMDNFGGYTAQAGNIFGYWREDDGRHS